MKKYFLILIIIFTISSCKKGKNYSTEINNNDIPEQRFESEFFSFNYPKDWKITDSEEIEKGIYYVSVEKVGFDSSGLITIVSFDELIDLDEMVMMNIEELKNNPSIGNLNFESISNSNFNKTKSRSSSFKFSALGIKHIGLVYAFNGNNSSYVLLKQGAIEDTNKNNEGFTTIEKSFEIK